MQYPAMCQCCLQRKQMDPLAPIPRPLPLPFYTFGMVISQ